ncbi:MAG: HypC/HybG/HupF family hydrogenase formation chaperone [Deltaproteobacteria bacterium]|nr:HypC/HybG/HupF family hydrogenase formation chaperone [Deltaproteobacteria bacterium]
MCIAFPGKVLSVTGSGSAVVDIGGIRQEVSVDLLADQVKPGDYVISHAGYAIQRIDETAARESLALLREILADEVS